MRKTCPNFAIFLIFVAKQQLVMVDNGIKKKKKKKVSHWQTRIVNSGDTNLIVCYLDAGRPMRWSYLCDRCSTPLHLQSQPAPSLQAVDLNSSESTQWEGKWWMECMESKKKKVESGPRPLKGELTPKSQYTFFLLPAVLFVHLDTSCVWLLAKW